MPDNDSLKRAFDKVGLKEDQRNEFKTSLFISPETSTPGPKQMRNIADTLAAFMNAEGGMLYLGVADDGSICGIEKDLALLAAQPQSVVVRSARYSDEGFTYGSTGDKYELKIRAIVRAYLSPNAGGLIGKVAVIKFQGVPVCGVQCKPCPADDFVYAYHWHGASKMETEEIVVRVGNQKQTLQGKARDDFVRRRVTEGFSKQLDALRESMSAAGQGAGGYDDVVASVRTLLERLDGKHLPGATITVSGGQPFTEESVTAAKKPKSLAWEGQHYAEVSGWQELVLKVLEKLQELDAAKFDELAGQNDFAKQFITIQKPKEKHGDCYPAKFGVEGKVRIKKSLGNKVYLWQEDKVLRKIIAAFGVDVSRFMFVPS